MFCNIRDERPFLEADILQLIFFGQKLTHWKFMYHVHRRSAGGCLTAFWFFSGTIWTALMLWAINNKIFYFFLKFKKKI